MEERKGARNKKKVLLMVRLELSRTSVAEYRLTLQ
jgi:hypothetical protein